MTDLQKKILSLQNISEALEPQESVRNEYVRQVSDYANQFINKLPSSNAYSDAKENRELFKINTETKSLQDILKIYEDEVSAKGIKPASGGHIGYIPGGGIYASALADYLVDVTNVYAGIYFASPGAVTMENELIDWMKSIFKFPESAVGNLTSGGSIANLIALTAARDKHKIKSDLVFKSVIYVSEQVHHCIHKALRIIGLEDVIIRYIALDSHSRMIPSDLEKKLEVDRESGLHPFLIIASAGTTDTGAIDPLKTIGNIAKANRLWFHVDAAYGGFFILTEQKKDCFTGIEMADSLVIDPHKGLFLPYGLGAVLVKDKAAVYHSNHYRANYMQDASQDTAPINPADVSPELTKHFRGFRLWLPLKLHGIKPFIACLEEKLLLTTYFRERLLAHGYMLGPDPDLSVSYFWYPIQNKDENEFNKRLMQEIHKNGSIFLSSTTINGKFVIRIAILSFRTKLETIDKAIEMIENARKKISKS